MHETTQKNEPRKTNEEDNVFPFEHNLVSHTAGIWITQLRRQVTK